MAGFDDNISKEEGSRRGGGLALNDNPLSLQHPGNLHSSVTSGCYLGCMLPYFTPSSFPPASFDRMQFSLRLRTTPCRLVQSLKT